MICLLDSNWYWEETEIHDTRTCTNRCHSICYHERYRNFSPEVGSSCLLIWMVTDLNIGAAIGRLWARPWDTPADKKPTYCERSCESDWRRSGYDQITIFALRIERVRHYGKQKKIWKKRKKEKREKKGDGKEWVKGIMVIYRLNMFQSQICVKDMWYVWLWRECFWKKQKNTKKK